MSTEESKKIESALANEFESLLEALDPKPEITGLIDTSRKIDQIKFLKDELTKKTINSKDFYIQISKDEHIPSLRLFQFFISAQDKGQTKNLDKWYKELIKKLNIATFG